MIEETRNMGKMDLIFGNDNKIIGVNIKITLHPNINYNKIADWILDNSGDIEVFDIAFDMTDSEEHNIANFNSIKKSDLKLFLKNCIDLYLMVYNLPAYTIILNKQKGEE